MDSMFRNAATNALQIAHELPSGWLDCRSVFDEGRERLTCCAAYLAGLEKLGGPDMWERKAKDWETVCAELAALVSEVPAKPIKLARVVKVLGVDT